MANYLNASSTLRLNHEKWNDHDILLLATILDVHVENSDVISK